MKPEKLLTYSIIKPHLDHIDEYIADIKKQYETGITIMPLLMFFFTPEGDNSIDKVTPQCEIYKKYKERLDELGIPSGVLVQSTIGHGSQLALGPAFTPLTSFKTGEPSKGSCCPLDPDFQKYFYDAMAKLASYCPKVIMIDDDWRTLSRAQRGCACEAHMKLFNETAGTNFTRQKLWDICASGTPEGKKYWKIWNDVQKKTLVDAVKALRAGIDSVDPTIQGVICTNKENHECAKPFAGKDNPSIARGSGSRYAPLSTRYYTTYFFYSALRINKLKGLVDIPIAESDSCPHNRYSMSASAFHMNYAHNLLEGYKGAKHWFTRSPYELESGVAYKEKFAKYKKFDDQLADDFDNLISYEGFKIPLIWYDTETPLEDTSDVDKQSIGWINHCFERIGLPAYFSNEEGGILCLERDCLGTYTDEDIKKFLSGKVILASDTAKLLCERGFSDLLGVDVRDWNGLRVTSEYFIKENNISTAQYKAKELVPLNNEVETLSWSINQVNGAPMTKLFPACTLYKNKLGGTVITFCGTPVSPFTFSDGFGFLTQTRKAQLINILNRVNPVPAYYASDDELYCKVGKMKDGSTLVALFPTSYDDIEEIKLGVNSKITSVKYLTPDGEKKEVEFTQAGNIITIKHEARPLNPEILYLK